jgi:hypothetical protein
MNKNINGPIIVVRLDGQIGKIKKIIYLFMDVHFNYCNQTKCEDNNNIDVHDFLMNELQINDENNKKFKTEKMIDIFIEFGHEDKRNYGDITFKYRDAYLTETIKTVIQLSKNKTYKFARYHGIDIREYFHFNVSLNIFDNMLLPS